MKARGDSNFVLRVEKCPATKTVASVIAGKCERANRSGATTTRARAQRFNTSAKITGDTGFKMIVKWQSVLVIAIIIKCSRAENTPVTIESSNDASNTQGSPEPQAAITNKTEMYNHDAEGLNRSIEIIDDSFVLDGKPLRLVSGSLHYFRVPAAYWRDRLRKFKQAGLNAVATYVEWSYHEPHERQYRFEGDYDLVQFVKLAAEEGLLVLLRPGPYICAERDLGGFPYWLLSKYPKIGLRSTDPDYMSEAKIWTDKLFEKMTPLLYGNGGPIILVQVENEYGSYASDKVYMEKSRDLLSAHVGNNALLYTTDGTSRRYFTAGSVEGALTTIDFGTGINVTSVFGKLRKFMPKGPLMNSEFYPGWLCHWGEVFPKVNTKPIIETLRDMLKIGASVNFYVFFGGTNFGFTAGANYFETYQPDITSYDYDAPLDEAGDPTPKYDAIRLVLEEYYPEVKELPRAVISKKGAYGPVTVQPIIRLLSPNGREIFGKKYEKVTGSSLPTFEQLWQNAGFVLYETMVHFNDTKSKNRLLKVLSPRDRVYVFVNDELKGTISRMHKIYSLPLKIQNNDMLSLLVENQGRINYGDKIHDFKGILQPVYIDKDVLAGEWTLTGFPLEEVPEIDNADATECNQTMSGPIMYEGVFTVEDEMPLDTFLDPTGWGKGYVWVNGHNLGRYWPLKGPQITLYVPGIWLKSGQNKIQILELEKAPTNYNMTFIDKHIWSKPSKKSK